MTDSNEIIPEIVPAAVLQQKVQFLQEFTNGVFCDKQKRISWVDKDPHKYFTYFLYDDQDRPIEMGELYFRHSGLSNMYGISCRPQHEIDQFFLTHPSRHNVLRAVYEEQPVESPADNQPELQPAAVQNDVLQPSTLENAPTEHHYSAQLPQVILQVIPSAPQPHDQPFYHQIIYIPSQWYRAIADALPDKPAYPQVQIIPAVLQKTNFSYTISNANAAAANAMPVTTTRVEMSGAARVAMTVPLAHLPFYANTS